MLDKVPGRLLMVLLVGMLLAGCLLGKSFLRGRRADLTSESANESSRSEPVLQEAEIAGRLALKLVKDSTVELWMYRDGSAHPHKIVTSLNAVLWDSPNTGLLTVDGVVWSYDGRAMITDQSSEGILGAAVKGAKRQIRHE